MNRNELLKNFAIGFIPIFVFILSDEFLGTEISLLIAIAVGLLYLIYYYFKYRTWEKFILLDTALIVLLGGISIILHDDIFFKLKPALIELILVAILGVHAFSSKPILLMMSKRYIGDIDPNSHQAQMMRQMSRLLFFIFLMHTILIVYSAYFWSKEIWGFISGGLFYLIFGVLLAGQWIYFKFFKKDPVKVGSSQKEEWFDLLDKNGKIIGKAPRHAVHGNPSLLHATVHLHVFNDRGQLFLQKRSQKKDLYPGYWDTAVGGHINSGERVEQALVREAAEELGLEVNHPRPLFRYIMRNQYESELVHSFEMQHNGPFKMDESEIEDGRFWSAFEIRKMIGKNILTPNFEQEFELLVKAGKFK